jgi:hypothetical protein
MNATRSDMGMQSDVLLIADEGITEYRIVISESASPSEMRGAEELQAFLEQMSGARLPISTDEDPMGEKEIVLGDNAHLRMLGIDVDFENLGDEGFVIRTAPPHLIIAGGRKRGTMYGVYAFLEEHLGCRWFTSKLSRIPVREHLAIGQIDKRQVPVLEYRDVYFLDARDPDWAARNRVNGTWTLTREHGGMIAFYPFGHSFYALIPPHQYFESHPEWFSLVDGERTTTGKYSRQTQLCLTNEDMIQQAITTVKEWVRDHPEANIFSISQNDGRGGWCECEKCKALEEKEGGAHSAPIINFVNRIAEAMAADNPDILIDTLAYSYSWRAPRNLRPLPNVVIRLVSGPYPRGEPACSAHAFDDGKCYLNADLREAIGDWARLTERIYIWDYIVNFRQYLLPFPNIHTFGPNIRYLVEHGVKGIFEQGSGDVAVSDMPGLKAYLAAKLLWNPNFDVETGVEEFLSVYFGDAAELMREYLNMFRKEVEGGEYYTSHMQLFNPHIDVPYLRPEVLAKAKSLLEEAESLVAGDEERLLRVRRVRLSLDYIKLSMAERIMALLDPEESHQSVRDWYRSSMDAFFSAAEATGITNWRATCYKGNSMEDLKKRLEAALI